MKSQLSKKLAADAPLCRGKIPNAKTRKAIAELEAGKGKRFSSVGAMIADLNARDRRH
jgi:hypothetical protein